MYARDFGFSEKGWKSKGENWTCRLAAWNWSVFDAGCFVTCGLWFVVCGLSDEGR